MIHSCAVKISEWCGKSLGSSEEERQVVQYGMEIVLDTAMKIAVILLAGLATGKLPAFAASLACFCSLRYWAGGIHCKTSFRCLVAMLAVCTGSVYSAFWLEQFGEAPFWMAAVFGCLCLALFAPGETGKSGFLSQKKRLQKKLGAVLWMAGGVILAVIINHSWWRWVLITPMFIEAISVIPCEMRKEKRHEERESGKSDQGTGGSIREKSGEQKADYDAL